MKKWLNNFWYYYKVPAIIILIILAVVLWFMPRNNPVKPDYNAAVVSPRGFSEEQLARIRSALEQTGKDQDGDGTVSAEVRVYRFTIGADGQDYVEISKLEADLVGKASGIFFTEDPEQFETSTNGIGKAANAVPVSDIPLLADCGLDDMYLLIRADAAEKYAALLLALTK